MFSASCPMDRHLKRSVSLFWIANACWGRLREFATANASYNGLGEFLCSAPEACHVSFEKPWLQLVVGNP